MQDLSSGIRSSLLIRRACELVRTLVEQGDICAALAAVPEECQGALKVFAVSSVLSAALTWCSRNLIIDLSLGLGVSIGSKTGFPAEEARDRRALEEGNIRSSAASTR